MSSAVATVSRPSSVMPPHDEDRQKLLDEATAGFRQSYKRIQAIIDQTETADIRHRHEIGVILTEMEDDKDADTSYGSAAIERMSALIDRGRCTVYNSLRFARVYTSEEVDELCKARNARNQPLSWTHVVHLLVVPRKDVRERLLRQCLEGNWTESQLLEHVKEKGGGRRGSSNAGRPSVRPTTLRGFVNNQVTLLSQTINRVDKVWAGKEKPTDQSFIDMLKSADPEELSRVGLEELTTHYDNLVMRMTSLSREVKNQISRAKKLKKKPVDLSEEDTGE